jgi:hypothetical protein
MEQSKLQESGLALSIRQPWAELILRGEKSVELRKWTTDYRGPLWLHASKKLAEVAPPLGDTPLFLGGYVGYATLQTIMAIDSRRWEGWRIHHCDPGPYIPGYFGWVLSDVVRFQDPLPAPGKLGLFEPDPEYVTLLRRRREESCR